MKDKKVVVVVVEGERERDMFVVSLWVAKICCTFSNWFVYTLYICI